MTTAIAVSLTELPAHESASQRAVPSPRILCIGDEVRQLLRIQRQLDVDFDVVLVANAEEGHAALAVEGPFDVIISGPDMLGENGEEFLAQMRAHSPDAERILLARRVDRTVRSIVWSDARVMRILMNPCTTTALREAVSDAMLRHRARHLRASAVPRVTPVSGNPCAVFQPLR